MFEKYCLPIEMITVYKCYYREKPRLPVLKGFQAIIIINLVSELWNTIEFPLRILYFTPNFTDMLFNVKPIVKILEDPVSKIQFFQLSPGEYFISILIIYFSIGVLFSIPLLLSRLLFFLRPTLNKNERNIIVWILISSVSLFFLVLLFSYFLLIPAVLNFFVFYGSEVIEPLCSFTQYSNFVSALFFSTGLVFQVPTVQVILSLSKIIDPIKMFNYWRPMIIFSTILAAVLTPSADPITQSSLSSALFLLHILGNIISINLIKKTIRKVSCI